MRHRGTLFASEDVEGIKAVFVLDGDRFSLEVDGEQWADWHVSLIALTETAVNEFRFSLDGDVVRFIPDRRLDFAYGAIPAIKKAQEAATKGFRAKRRTRKAVRHARTPVRSESALPPPSVGTPPEPSPVLVEPAPTPPSAVPPISAAPPAEVTAPVAAAPTDQTDAETDGVDVVAGWARSPYDQATPTAASAKSPVDSPTRPSPPPVTNPIPESVEPVEPVEPVNGEIVIDLRSAVEEAVEALSKTPRRAEPASPKPPKAAPPSPTPAHVASKAEPRSGLRLLDRVRQARAEHVHDYEVSSSGVMVRRVCTTCNHVSIGSSD